MRLNWLKRKDRVPKRGDVYMARLNPSEGSEQTGERPVIVVSRDAINENSPVVIVVPVTDSKHKKAHLPQPGNPESRRRRLDKGIRSPGRTSPRPQHGKIPKTARSSYRSQPDASRRSPKDCARPLGSSHRGHPEPVFRARDPAQHVQPKITFHGIVDLQATGRLLPAH